MRKKIDISHFAGSDKEKVSVLLAEIALLRGLLKTANDDVKEELQQEVHELVAHVNGIINKGKIVIKTINHN